jgi:1,2-dihydroxy-3-keto-5-methylthiopentene dioxygenase
MELTWTEAGAAERPEAPTLEDLAAIGVHYEQMKLDPEAYQPSLDELKAERGYIEQDIVELKPDMDNLEAICDKFKDEHLHTDDEVRLVLEGEGIFDLRSKDDEWMRATVVAGDLLVVPANLHHRFFLTDKKHIRCVRLFKDAEGWVAHYRNPQ